MADRPQNHDALAAFAFKVFGGNPFPKDDTRHELWESNARYAAEEYARLDAKWLERLPSTGAQPEEFLSWILDAALEHYDILFKRTLIFTVTNVSSVGIDEQFLADVVKNIIDTSRENCPRSIPKELLLSELRIRFKQRKPHWTAEALRLARESEEPRGGTPLAAEIQSQSEEALQVVAAAGDDSSKIIEEPRGRASAQPTTTTESPTREVAGTPSEERAWAEIDHKLVKLMADRFESEIEQKYASLVDQIRPKANAPEPEAAYVFPLGVARLCVERTKESVSEYFRIYGEVWEEHQCKTRTASFVRVVFARDLVPCLDKGIANVKQTLKGASSRPAALGDHAGEDEIAIRGDDINQDALKLKEKWQNSIEIEARKLEWKEKGVSSVEYPSDESSGASKVAFEKGERCERVVNEVKLVEHEYVNQGRKMTEIQEEHPNLLVWEIRNSLDAEDREIFQHPRQWGPVVGYAERLMEKSEHRSRSTIQRWRKQYKSSLRRRNPRTEAALELVRQGKTVRQILRAQIRGFDQLGVWGRMLAEKALRQAISRGRRTARRD